MSKSPDAFRTISEVADWLDKPAHVLRFWESKFTQVKPVKRAGGRRYYRPEDMMLLGGIKTLLHDDGMTIKGVQKVLREQGVKHVCSLSQPIDEPISGSEETAPIEAHANVPTPGEAAAAFDVPEAQSSAEVLRFERDRTEDTRPPEPEPVSPPPADVALPQSSVPDTETSQDVSPEPEDHAPALAEPAPSTTSAPGHSQEDAPDAEPSAEQPASAPSDPQEMDDAAVAADPETAARSEPTVPEPSAMDEVPNADILPAFMRAPLQPAPPPSTPEPVTATPDPFVVDVPDVPPLDEFDTAPGVLSAALRPGCVAQGENRVNLAAAHSNLGRLRDKILQRAKD